MTKKFEYFEKDFPTKISITDETVKIAKENSGKYRGSVRVSSGRFYTDNSYSEFRMKTWGKSKNK